MFTIFMSQYEMHTYMGTKIVGDMFVNEDHQGIRYMCVLIVKFLFLLFFQAGGE